ncbi:hypothetical protein ISCGN_008581 [Ixodes scapularis]
MLHDAHCMQTTALRTLVVESETMNCLERIWRLESIGVTDKEEATLQKQWTLGSFKESSKQVGFRNKVDIPRKPNVSLNDKREPVENVRPISQIVFKETPHLLL